MSKELRSDDRLLDHLALERSSIVANSTMNRSRAVVGVNSYERELRFDFIDWLRARAEAKGNASWLDLCCGEGHAAIQAAQILQLQESRVEIAGIDLVAINSGQRGPVVPNWAN